jgi:hypothetical protein
MDRMALHTRDKAVCSVQMKPDRRMIERGGVKPDKRELPPVVLGVTPAAFASLHGRVISRPRGYPVADLRVTVEAPLAGRPRTERVTLGALRKPFERPVRRGKRTGRDLAVRIAHTGKDEEGEEDDASVHHIHVYPKAMATAT